MQGQCNFEKWSCTTQFISKTLRYLSFDIAMSTAARLKVNTTAFWQLLQNWPNRAHLHGPCDVAWATQSNQTHGSSLSSYTALHPCGRTQVSSYSSDTINLITCSTNFLTRNPPLHLGVKLNLCPISTRCQLPLMSDLDWIFSAGTP